MNNRLLITLVFLSSALAAFCQFGVGVRDSRFIYGDFTFRRHWTVKLEESVFPEKIGLQYLRAYAGYKGDWKSLDYDAQAYFGACYNGNYHSYGLLASARYTLFDRVMIDGKINPHYDSGYGYKTCFYAGAGVKITKNIDVLAGYTTIPEYRMSEKRVHAGFDFHVNRLSVQPMLSIETSGDRNAKTLRTLVGFRYQF